MDKFLIKIGANEIALPPKSLKKASESSRLVSKDDMVPIPLKRVSQSTRIPISPILPNPSLIPISIMEKQDQVAENRNPWVLSVRPHETLGKEPPKNKTFSALGIFGERTKNTSGLVIQSEESMEVKTTPPKKVVIDLCTPETSLIHSSNSDGSKSPGAKRPREIIVQRHKSHSRDREETHFTPPRDCEETHFTPPRDMANVTGRSNQRNKRTQAKLVDQFKVSKTKSMAELERGK
ncbi:hypothetical protein NEOLI_004843 [Neolecta irregularis DAH-3]|uniref:Uncharacterized protein n=1 Tax=Neolecta irregularis (strain DAH-3) TaxID=1198029 RepID=A0A1U7LJP3_NEOID|nr:hypothetical protein NEOLI_004843 [Neolecta irregularis DAH-3]|eukprot:OLL22867.1 hypothetical protein NEOLI_004843 [Neolecta irregularis DAH-3]